jgi:hypothetical protein
VLAAAGAFLLSYTVHAAAAGIAWASRRMAACGSIEGARKFASSCQQTQRHDWEALHVQSSSLLLSLGVALLRGTLSCCS